MGEPEHVSSAGQDNFSGIGNTLEMPAGILLIMPDLNLRIEGHTNSTGSAEYNQQQSEERAASVREFLAEQRIAMNEREGALSARCNGGSAILTPGPPTSGTVRSRHRGGWRFRVPNPKGSRQHCLERPQRD